MPRKMSETLIVRLPKDLMNDLKKQTKKQNTFLSNIVRTLLDEYLKHTRRSPDEIRFSILKDDRRRYVEELILEGLRPIDVTQEIYRDILKHEPIPFIAYQFLLVLDSKSRKIWFEMPPFAIGELFLKTGKKEVRKVSFLGEIFDEDVFTMQDWEIKRKFLDWVDITRKKGGEVVLNLEPNPTLYSFLPPKTDYIFSYTTPSISKHIHRASAKNLEEVIDRLYDEKIKPLILNPESSGLPQKQYPIIVTFLDDPNLKGRFIAMIPGSRYQRLITETSKEEFEVFLRCLRNLWFVFYSEESKASKVNDIVILKLSEKQRKVIEEAYERGEIERPESAIYVAINDWCRKSSKERSTLLRIEKYPYISKALKTGYHKNILEAVQAACDLYNRYLSRISTKMREE